MDPRFAHIRDWIFDLDNCLYPASTELFALIDERMGAYIQRLLGVDPVEARRIQKAYFIGHGTTLSGLMADHGVDPHEFLDYVHDVDLARVEPSHLDRLTPGFDRQRRSGAADVSGADARPFDDPLVGRVDPHRREVVVQLERAAALCDSRPTADSSGRVRCRPFSFRSNANSGNPTRSPT